MKLKNKLKHEIEVENEDGIKVSFILDPSDMVQIGVISELFAKFDEVSKIKIEDNLEEIEEILKTTRLLSKTMLEMKELIDLAFGDKITQVAFKNSNSLILYNDFFVLLEKELVAAGIKVQEYIKERRKERLVNDRKESDTI